MRWPALVLCLFICATSQAATYYTSPSGSGTTCSQGVPCSAEYGVNTKAVAGDTVCLADPTATGATATYNNKYSFTAAGALGNPITVKSCNGAWAKFDGYLASTLAVALPNSAGDPVTVVFSSNPGFPTGRGVWIDQNTANAELVFIAAQQGDGVTWTNCARGFGGFGFHAHAIGAPVENDDDLLTIGGQHTYYRDFEVMNSGPNRALNTASEDIVVATRGEGVTVHPSTGIKLINLVIHDNREGILAAVDAVDLEIYGCLIYNNGLVDVNRGHGEGYYLLNQTTQKKVRNIIAWNGFGDGGKNYSESQFAQNFLYEHVISFNNGVNSSYAGNPAGSATTSRYANMYGGTGNSNNPINDLLVHDCYLYHPINADPGVGNMAFGYQGIGATGLEITNSRIIGGKHALTLAHFKSGTVTGNKIYAQGVGTFGTGNDDLIKGDFDTPVSFTINNNTYYDQTPLFQGTTAYPFIYALAGVNQTTCEGGSALRFTYTGCSPNGGWKEITGFDAASSYSYAVPNGDEVFVTANEYNSNVAHLAVYNWSHAGTKSVSVAGIFNNGDTIAFYPAEAGTYPQGSAFQSLTVVAGAVTITTSGWSVLPVIGNASMGGFVPATVSPEFVAGILLRTAQVGTASSVLGGSATKGSSWH